MRIEVEINIPEKEKKKIIDNIIILVDTREKNNNHILGYFDSRGIKYEITKLDLADYSFKIEKNEYLDKDINFTNHIVIERKGSLEELSSNFSSDRIRWETELATLYDKKVKTFLVIEGAFNSLIMGEYNTKYDRNAYIGSFMTFCHRYNLIPMFTNKMLSGETIYNIFKYYFYNLIK